MPANCHLFYFILLHLTVRVVWCLLTQLLLCTGYIVHCPYFVLVALVNLLLKKMMMMMTITKHESATTDIALIWLCEELQ